MPNTYYLYDPINGEVDRELDENGNVIVEYTREPDGMLISENRGGVSRQYHFDADGNTLALTDDSGNITDTFAYNASGQATERTGTTPTPYQYHGQQGYYRDSETGDYRVQRRDYSPEKGRWLSADTSGILDLTNLYVYVWNSLANLVDASILAPEDAQLLRIKVKEKPQLTGKCGGAKGAVTYIIAPPGLAGVPILKKNLKGTVIQRITFETEWFHCFDGTLAGGYKVDYLEGFPVKGSIPHIDSKRQKPMDPWGLFMDTLYINDFPGVKGNATITGCVVYMPDYEIEIPPWQEEKDVKPPLPVKTGGVPVLIGAWPKGFDELKLKCRSLSVEWDCCCPPKEPELKDSGWEEDKDKDDPDK